MGIKRLQKSPFFEKENISKINYIEELSEGILPINLKLIDQF